MANQQFSPDLRAGKGPCQAVPRSPCPLLRPPPPPHWPLGQARSLCQSACGLLSCLCSAQAHCSSLNPHCSSPLSWPQPSLPRSFSALIRCLATPLTLLFAMRTPVPTLRLPVHTDQESSSPFLACLPFSYLEPPKYLLLTFSQFTHRRCLGLKNTSTNVLIFLLYRGRAYLLSS